MTAAFEKMAEAYPLGPIGEPREMAEAALRLTSPASSFVTGHVLVADGGFTAKGEPIEELFAGH